MNSTASLPPENPEYTGRRINVTLGLYETTKVQIAEVADD